MRSVLISIVLLSLGLLYAPSLRAQDDHFEVGAYGDYLRVTNLGNLWGVGGNIAVGFDPHFLLEGQATYDFEQTFAQGFTGPSGTVTFVPSPFKDVNALFGPVIQTNGTRAGIFYVTVKGGFIDFMTSAAPASVSGFTGAFNNTSGWDAVLYPAGGLKGFIGPIGLRVEVGDLIYFASGAHNNLRITAGPEFRF